MNDAVWEALTRALSGEYEIVARLGLGSGGAPVYLARELLTDNFVALRLPPLVSGNEAQEYGLEVVRQIDSSLPEIETVCSHCGTTVRQWSRFCSRCGRDISGLAPSSNGQSREQLLILARRAAAGKYQLLGDMTRAEGGGLVYFGRELSTRDVVGLQLEQAPDATIPMMTLTRFAPGDPSFQLPETRRRSGGRPAPAITISKEFSIPKGIERVSASTPASSRPAVGEPSAYSRLLTRVAVVAVLVLIIVVTSLLTCARP